MVSASYLPWHRCHDGFLFIDIPATSASDRSSCTDRYIRCIHRCNAHWIHTGRIRCNRYYRRCGWSYSHLSVVQACAASHGSYRGIGIFIHGSGPCDPASDNASDDDKKGKTHQDEDAKNSQPEGEDHIPYRRIHSDGSHRSFWHASSRYALLR